MSKRNRRILPGFGLSLGYTLLYFGLIGLMPLAACALKAASLTPHEFWQAVSSKRAVAAYIFTVKSAFIASLASVALGLLIAWSLTRYEFPLKRVFDSLVDLPFALPTAVAGLVYSQIYAPKGWIGQFLTPLGVKVAYTPYAVWLVLTFLGIPFVVRSLQPVSRRSTPMWRRRRTCWAPIGGRRFTACCSPRFFPR